MGKSGIVIRVIITLLFFASLYFVEAGFCGSSVVAKYNGGFGTLDMKHYDVKMVQNVLSSMSETGVAVYKHYYLMDFIFILCFGVFQIMLTRDVFSFERSKWITMIVCSIPILRGICDMIENAVLLWTLSAYPKISELAISISAKATSVKLMSIGIWILMIAIGLIWKVILYLKR